MTPEQLFEGLLNLINTGTTVATAVGFVLIATQFVKWGAAKLMSIIKRKPVSYDGDSARWITLTVQVAVWGVYALMRSRGQETNFDNYIKIAESLLTNLGYILFPAIVTGLATARSYQVLRKNNVPGFHHTADEIKKAA